MSIVLHRQHPLLESVFRQVYQLRSKLVSFRHSYDMSEDHELSAVDDSNGSLILNTQYYSERLSPKGNAAADMDTRHIDSDGVYCILFGSIHCGMWLIM